MGPGSAELEQAAVRRLAELIEQQRGDSAAHTIRLRRDEIPIVIRTAAARLHVDGVLSLSDGRRHKRFHYRQGEIVDVESSVESDWLGKMLLAEGLITETQLNAAERAVGPRGSAVGEELAARGAISRADLEAARTRQREAVFASVCEWDGAEVGCEHAAAGATGRETVAQPPSAVAAGAQRAAPPPGESNLTPSIRPTIVLAVYYLFLGFVLAYLPLTNYLGLEFSLAVAVAAGLCAGPYAVGRNRDFASDTTVARWTKIATIHALAACLSLAGLAYRVLDDPPCAPCRGAGFFVLLPMVSVWYGSAWGVACGAAIRRKRLAQLAVVLIALATLAWSGLDFVRKPTVWFYNPFFGHFPGPIYDEGISPTPTLIYYRLGNLAQAWLLALAVGLWTERRRNPTPNPSPREGGESLSPRAEAKSAFPSIVLVIVLAAVALGLHLARFELGWDMDEAHLRQKLDGYLRTEHFDIYYPRRADIEREIDLAAHDHEFRFAQIERELGIKFPHRIASFIYASEEEKKKLIGAAGTEYADCAKHEMHLNWEHFPFEILHHEMIHVMLGDDGLPLLGFSAKIAVTEGVAAAFGGPPHWDQDLDRWAAGMLAMDRLPRMKQILGARFWSESGARAYTAAGAFIRFLAAKPDGVAKLRRAYRWGNLSKEFGRPLRELDDEWRTSLAAIKPPLTPAEIERARHRFGAKSMFEMRCPREVARLTDEADKAADRRYFEKADLLYLQAAQLDRNEARISRLRLPPLLRMGKLDEAVELARKIVEAQGTPERPARDKKGRIVGSQIVAQEAELTLADIAWARGQIDAARAIYQRIAAAAYRPSTTRQALAALYAFGHPVLEPALRAYFTSFSEPNIGRWELAATSRAHPGDPMLCYLLARRALEEGAFGQAADLLGVALSDLQFAAADGAAPLRDEAIRALGYSRFMLGDLPGAKNAFELLRSRQIGRGEPAIAARDWLERIEAWPGLAGACK